MNSTPLVSIIVPVYNTAPYLRQCLDSICNQTYKNLEIICINDGSTDNSAEILAEYAAKDSRVIVISQENAGQSAARNKALDIAKGEWVTGVDSDDYLSNYAIAAAVKHTTDPEIDIVLLTTRHFPDNNHKKTIFSTYEILRYSGKQKVTEKIIINTPVFFWGKLWKKDIINSYKLRFPLGLWAEDELFWNITLPHCQYIYYENNVKDCYNYRKHQGSSLAQLNAKNGNKGLAAIKIAELLCQYYAEHNIRQSWGYQTNKPTLVEICKLEHLYRKTIQWTQAQYYGDLWQAFRNIIDDYHFETTLSTHPQFALFYYLHPTAVIALNKLYTNKTPEDIQILYSYPKLIKEYRILKLRYFFSIGEKRNQISYKLKSVKEQIRKYRYKQRQILDMLQS